MVFKDMLFKSWGDRTVHSPSDTFISEIEQFTDTCIKGRVDLIWVRKRFSRIAFAFMAVISLCVCLSIFFSLVVGCGKTHS
jgi:hypothetical protein